MRSKQNTNELILLKLDSLDRSIEHVRERVRDVRAELKDVRTEIGDVRNEIKDVRQEFNGRMDNLASEIRDVRNEMRSSIRHGQIITASVIGIALAVVYAVLR